MYRTQSYREPLKRPKWALLVCVQGFLSDMARDSDSSVAGPRMLEIVPEVILPGDFQVTPSRERWRWVG